MAHEIKFRGPGLGYTDFVWFLFQVEYAMGRDEELLEVDFDSVKIFYPNGMAPFVVMVDYLRSKDVSVDVRPPAEQKLYYYWDKAGWLDVLRGSDGSSRQGSTFVPLTRYSSAEEIHSFLSLALGIIAGADTYPKGVLEAVEWSFSEISDNVLQHSESPRPSWLQMTKYEDKVDFVVLDTGRGIRSSLSESISDLSSDKDAVRRAVGKGITRNREVGQGNGLSGTVRIISKADGWMNLHSNRGQLRVVGGSMYDKTVPNFPGTLVTVTIPTDRPIELSEALWGHAPLAMADYLTGEGVLFEVAEEASHFGNRATGKKMRHKLRNLAELYPEEAVIVDFNGITVLSASFADEFIAKLVKEYGMTHFMARFRLKGLSGFAATTIDRVIAQRLFDSA